MTTAALSQSQFRGRSDTSSPDTAATFIAALNTNFNRDAGSPFRIRYTIQETAGGNPNAHTVKLQANLNGGAFQDVTSSSTVVQSSTAASTSADETAITSKQLSGTGTFANGVYSEDGSTSTSVDLVASGSTEYEFGVVIVANDVKGSDTIQLKVVALSGTSITATQTPTVTVNAGVAKTSVISVSQAESVTARRSTAHIITVSFAETVTLIRGTSHKIAISIGLSLSAIAFPVIRKLINVSQAQDVSGFAVAHILSSQTSAGLAQLVSAVANFVAGGGASTTNKSISVSQSQSVSLLRAVAKIIAVTQAQAVTLLRSSGKLIALTQAESVSLLRSVGKLISVAQGESLSLLRAMSTTLRVSQAESLLLLRGVSHGIAVGQSQDVSGIAAAHIRSSQTGAGIGESVTLSAVRAGTTTNKLISVAQAQAVTLLRAVRKVVAITQAQAITLVRAIATTVRVSIAQAVVLLRSAGHRVAVSQSQDVSGTATAHILSSQTGTGLGETVTLTEHFSAFGAVTNKAISVVQSQTVTLYRAVKKLIAVTLGIDVSGVAAGHIRSSQSGSGQGQNVTVSRLFTFGGVTKLISVTLAQSVTLRRSIKKLISVVQDYFLYVTVEAHLLGTFGKPLIGHSVRLIKSIAHRIAVSIGELVTVATQFSHSSVQFIKAINVSQAQLVTLLRSVAHRIAVSIGQSVSLARSIAHLVGVGIGQSVRLVFGFARRLVVAIGETVTLDAAKEAGSTTNVALQVVQTQAVSLLRSVGHLIAVAIGSLVTLRRSAARIVSVAIGQSIRLVRAARVTLTIALAQAVSLAAIAAIKRTIVVGIGSTVTLAVQVFRLITTVHMQINVAMAESVRLLRAVVLSPIVAAIDQAVSVSFVFFGNFFSLLINTEIGQRVTRVVSIGKTIAIGIGQVVRLLRRAPVWSARMSIYAAGGVLTIKTAGGSVDINVQSGTVTVHEV